MGRYGAIAAAIGLTMAVAACGDGDGGGGGGGDAGAGGGRDEPLRAAIINVDPVTSGDWEPANFAAFNKMVRKWGFEPSNEDGVSYDEAEAVLARLAQSNDLVIASSAGYGDAVLKTAPKFPDTFFVVFSNLSSTKGLPNVAGFSSDWSQLGYVSGAVACAVADGAKVGHVNSEPIPAFTKFAGGMEQAAEEHCANGRADYLQTWIRSFNDISKAKQAALQQVDQGAAVLVPTCDTAGRGVVEAAKQTDKKLVMSYVDQSALAPQNVVTSWRFTFDRQYDRIGELFSKGQLEPKIYPQNFQNGGINVVLPLANVSPAVAKQVEQVVAGLRSGEIVVEPRELQP
jgi:basic membrane protein A and related proteins